MISKCILLLLFYVRCPQTAAGKPTLVGTCFCLSARLTMASALLNVFLENQENVL